MKAEMLVRPSGIQGSIFYTHLITLSVWQFSLASATVSDGTRSYTRNGELSRHLLANIGVI